MIFKRKIGQKLVKNRPKIGQKLVKNRPKNWSQTFPKIRPYQPKPHALMSRLLPRLLPRFPAEKCRKNQFLTSPIACSTSARLQTSHTVPNHQPSASPKT